MERTVTGKIGFVLLAALLLFLVVVYWRFVTAKQRKSTVQLRGSGDTLIIAATGDWFARKPMPSDDADRGYAGVIQVVKSASLGLTTLEETLLDEKNVPAPEEEGISRWPYGTKREAEDLRRSGFTLISLANNHSADYGVEGMKQTREILDREGLLHAGSGVDLQQANAPVFVGAAPRRVAVIAVTTSANSESRATYTQGEILGRPGVNLLRYSAHVTVDPPTFAILDKSRIDARSERSTDSNQLTLSGTVIEKGQKTAVEFVANEQDSDGVLAQIRLARSKADIVVVMLHSHEPSDESDAPPEFVNQFDRAAIDAGASLVSGDGAHQLRGIESYRGGLIFYGLGNFAYEYDAIDPSAVDIYDKGVELFRFTLGVITNLASYPAPSLEESIWWESVIAIVEFDHGTLRSMELHPIDLGVDLPLAQRGTPRLATGERGTEILQRLARLSQNLGTQVRIENGLGFVDVHKSQPPIQIH